MQTVYILKYSDGTFYYGCTSDLKSRLIRHLNGKVSYTSERLPVEVVTYIVFSEKWKAFKFEKYLKSGSGRAFLRKRLV